MQYGQILGILSADYSIFASHKKQSGITREYTVIIL